MIWTILLIIAIVIVLKNYFNVVIDLRKEYGVIWYTYKGKRDGIVLWGSKY